RTQGKARRAIRPSPGTGPAKTPKTTRRWDFTRVGDCARANSRNWPPAYDADREEGPALAAWCGPFFPLIAGGCLLSPQCRRSRIVSAFRKADQPTCRSSRTSLETMVPSHHIGKLVPHLLL